MAGGNPFNVAATPSITYTYDSGFHGVLSSVTSGSNTTSYSFDSLGRISGSTQTTPGYSPFTFGYGYSLTDQRTSITYPSGRLVQLTLDAADRVTAVQKPGGAGNYATINYTAPSGISSLTMGNGVSENVSWNDRLQPVGLTAAAGSTNLLTLGLYPCPGAVTACASANNGDVQSQAISFPALNGASPLSVTQAYTYDSVNRLTQATETGTSNWTQQYGYDTAGNRWVSNNTGLPGLSAETPQTSNWYSVSPVPNRIYNAAANPLWGYDANGNMQQVGGTSRSFTYDAENRQVSATVNGVMASYSYDGNGQRVSRTVGGQTTVYVYDAFGNLAAEYGPSAGSPCGTPTCYLTVDHLGSTRLMTDATGSVSTLHRYDYLPFGEEILSGIDGRAAGMGYVASPDTNEPKFTGQYRDPETGLDWFNVRHMSGTQGRFQGVDPANAGASLTDPQTWNGYAYVGNNPVTSTDPSGMAVCTACVGALTGNPVGAVVGSAIELGIGLYEVFSHLGYSGPPVPNWAGTAWELGPDQATPGVGVSDGNAEPWSEQSPVGMPGRTLNTGTIFGSGNTDPFVFSLSPDEQILLQSRLPPDFVAAELAHFKAVAWAILWRSPRQAGHSTARPQQTRAPLSTVPRAKPNWATCLLAPSWFVQGAFGANAEPDDPLVGNGNEIPWQVRIRKKDEQVTAPGRQAVADATAGAVSGVLTTASDCALHF